jgi:hypothetical protein
MRRYDPVHEAQRQIDSDSNSDNNWDQTLVRFQAHFDVLFCVQNGQPSESLAPEKALAKLKKFVKEDLKRSVSGFFYCVFVHRFTNSSTWQQPLHGTVAGKGKRPRDGETYLRGLLQEIHLADLDPAPSSSGSAEYYTIAEFLSGRKHSFASFRRNMTE